MITEFPKDELLHLATKAALPEKLVLDIAAETTARFRDVWAAQKKNLLLAENVIAAVEAHAPKGPIYSEL